MYVRGGLKVGLVLSFHHVDQNQVVSPEVLSHTENLKPVTIAGQPPKLISQNYF